MPPTRKPESPRPANMHEMIELRGSLLRSAARNVLAVDRSALRSSSALRPLAVVATVLALGFAFNHIIDGVFLASGAFSVGFGSFQRLRSSRGGPMVLATCGISFAALLGTLLGHNTLAFSVVAGLCALLLGLASALSFGAWWIALQSTIFLLIASHYPTSLSEALPRIGEVFIGGLLQTSAILLLWRNDALRGVSSAPPDAPVRTFARVPFSHVLISAARKLRRNSTLRTQTGREALRLALTVGSGVFISRVLAGYYPNQLVGDYWLPMTVLLVMKSDLNQTFKVGLQRMAGTVAGAGLTTLLLVWLQPGPVAMIALVLPFAWICYNFLKANYALFALALTAYVVFLLGLIGLPGTELISARVTATLLGGVLAIAAHLITQPFALFTRRRA